MNRAAKAFAALALLAPFTAAADVRITEISYDPQGSDSKREWVEIFNAGSDPVDLSKLKFADSANHVLNAPPKNGSMGTMLLAPSSYAVLAADAATFRALYPAVSEVIDTTMSLKNDGGTVSLSGPSGVIDSFTYSSGLGASGDGDSLQLNSGSWIHAEPTPGAANATTPAIHAVPAVAAKAAATKTAKAKTIAKTAAAKTSSTKSVPENNDADDPMQVVNAEPSDAALSQTAAVGSLGTSMWWLAAGALAVIVGAIASLITRQKRGEWDIVDSE